MVFEDYKTNPFFGLYYIQKKQNLILCTLNKSSVSEGYLFSVVNDIYPFFEESKETEYFEAFYDVKKELIVKVLNELQTIDDKCLVNYQNNNCSEDAYNGLLPDYWGFLSSIDIRRNSTDDYRVYKILRYIYLENKNYKPIFENFVKTENCPIEYQGLTTPLNREEIFNNIV